MINDPEWWMQVLAPLWPRDAAERILSELEAYPLKTSPRYKEDDIQQLANALVAWDMRETADDDYGTEINDGSE